VKLIKIIRDKKQNNTINLFVFKYLFSIKNLRIIILLKFDKELGNHDSKLDDFLLSGRYVILSGRVALHHARLCRTRARLEFYGN